MYTLQYARLESADDLKGLASNTGKRFNKILPMIAMQLK